MSNIEASPYRPHLLLRQPDLATALPALFRKVPQIEYKREVVELPDGDFIDVDWWTGNQNKGTLAILVHGLEGESQSPYMKGMTRSLSATGMDVLAINHRGCSGRPNRLLVSYHSGHTADLFYLIHREMDRNRYDQVVIVGFSLGGLITLKLLGEHGDRLPEIVKAGVAIGTPCDVAGSCYNLQRLRNRPYLWRFMGTLRQKAIEKKRQFPDAPYTEKEMRKAKDFVSYDSLYTARVHGFRDAAHYYEVASSHHYIPHIEVPTLLLNAQDDPFLTPTCYPHELARKIPHFHLETPKYGGHVGYCHNLHMKGDSYSEQRARDFLTQVLDGF